MIAIIQARTSSKRFPGKVLYEIKKTPMIIHVINKIKASEKVKEIIVSTSTDKSDNKLCSLLKKKNIKYYRGSLKNVALRFYNTAKKYQLRAFIRVSADSPLINPMIINRAIDIFKKNKKFDIVTNVFPKTFPSGQSVEVIRTKLLKKYLSKMNIYEKEHVTPFFYANSSKYKIYNFRNNLKKNYKKNIKFSIDRKSDLKKILKFFQ